MAQAKPSSSTSTSAFPDPAVVMSLIERLRAGIVRLPKPVQPDIRLALKHLRLFASLLVEREAWVAEGEERERLLAEAAKLRRFAS
jgi:hypothetical protein